MHILHVDVDNNFKLLLTQGKQFLFPLTSQTLKKINHKNEIEVITFKSQSRIDQAVLDAFPNLKLLVARMVGTDNVNHLACKDRSIALYHIPDYGSHNIAEHALALILAGARHIVPADKEVHKGTFSYRNFLGKSIRGKTVGVVGTGKIGIALIRLLQSFGVTIVAFDVIKNEEAAKELGFTYRSLEQVLKESDIISLHVPLMKETEHFMGEKQFMMMKLGAILVNTSRGAIIDTKALVKQAKKFHAIGLDVVEGEEKFSRMHPLLKYKNVLMTPHIGFYTDDSIMRIAKETENCIEKFRSGNPQGRVL